MAREIDVDALTTPRIDREKRAAVGIALIQRGASLREAAAQAGMPMPTLYDFSRRAGITSGDQTMRVAAMAQDALEAGIARVHDEIATTDARNVAGWIKESRETYLELSGNAASDGVSELAATIFDRIAQAGVNVNIEITPADSPKR